MRLTLPLLAILLLIAVGLLFPVSTPLHAMPAPQSAPTVRILYFYSVDCPHCQTVQEEVLAPLEAKYPNLLDIRRLEIKTAANYELLIRAEELYSVSAERRGIPTLAVGDRILIGEDEIRSQLSGIIQQALAGSGIDWPEIPGLEAALDAGANSAGENGGGTAPLCGKTTVSCAPAAPIWAAYFYQVGCQECSRAKVDLDYVRSRYPQLVVQEFNIYSEMPLAQWLAQRAGRTDFHSPAVFVGQDALIGEAEINPKNLEALAEKYASGGTPKIWTEFNRESGVGGLVERFRSLPALTIVFAGLVDGLNPCAFATIIFFVSYLSISGRKGRAILAVGGTFTFGIFLAYLGVGLGAYKLLDMMGELLTTLGRWVYAITAVLCAVLAVYSFMDFLKARRGDIGDMTLNLPESMRLRINSVIRQGRHVRAYVAGAFVTGIVVAFLELACTGQVYLPTIIFVTSIPELRVQAIGYLILYNLLFILPLIAVFIMAYFGTTSKDFTRFLQKNAAAVKLGMVVLFTALAGWLTISLL